MIKDNKENFKGKAQKGVLWSSIDNLGSQLIQFIFAIIIARLLTPEDYGIIAMPTVFIALSQCFVNSGFSGAIVRKLNIKVEDLSTAFLFSVSLGIIFYLILFFSSTLIASFYKQPILIDLLRVTALSLIFNPLFSVHQAILTREMNFRSLAIITLISSIVSGCIAIIIAYNGYGVWALVFQQVSTFAVKTLLMWSFSNWKPIFCWSKESFEYLWGYGSKMLASALLDTTYKNISPVIIGKYYASADLGNYTRASHFADLPSQNITGVLQKVTFPLLASIQDDDERIKRIYHKLIRISSLTVFPTMMILSALSKPLVLILLSEKWIGCVLFLEILCFTRMWFPVHVLNLNLLQVKGRSDLFFKLEIAKKIIGLTAMVITLPFGIIYFVISGLFTSILSLFINTYYTGKYYNLTFISQMRDVIPIFCVSMISFVSIHCFIRIIDNVYLQLFGGVTIGVVVFLFASTFLLKSELLEIIDVLPQRISNKRIISIIRRHFESHRK